MRGSQEGYCICPYCGKKQSHYKGYPCFRTNCPECGATLERDHDETSVIHEELLDEVPPGEHKSDDVFPKVDKNGCISCGICITNCPANAIVFRDGKAFILNDDCENCGLCMKTCPQNAISRKQ